jgi:hypothetical protein
MISFSHDLLKMLRHLAAKITGAALSQDDMDGDGSSEEAAGERVALLDPIEELTDVRPLLQQQLEEDELSPQEEVQLSPQEEVQLSGLLTIVERLEGLTAWSRDELLDNIGCEHRDANKLVKDKAKIERCTSFLETLLDAAQRVDEGRSRRAVVKRCARLSKSIEVDAAGLERILGEGEFSALEYIELGELSSAERVARIAAGKQAPAGEFGPSPYDHLPTVHLSVPRVDLYVRGERDVLGERTFENMKAHVDECLACKGAVASRQALVDRK